MTSIIGMKFSGYTVEDVRIKYGSFTDGDHYGIILAKNSKGYYATWQCHLDENDKPTVYWGHYHMENRDAAIRDYNTRE